MQQTLYYNSRKYLKVYPIQSSQQYKNTVNRNKSLPSVFLSETFVLILNVNCIFCSYNKQCECCRMFMFSAHAFTFILGIKQKYFLKLPQKISGLQKIYLPVRGAPQLLCPLLLLTTLRSKRANPNMSFSVIVSFFSMSANFLPFQSFSHSLLLRSLCGLQKPVSGGLHPGLQARELARLAAAGAASAAVVCVRGRSGDY